MQSKLSVIVLLIFSLCSVTACNDEPKNTDEPVVAVAAKPDIPAPWKRFETIQDNAAVGPVVNVSIDFGIKSKGNMMECKPGAGICEPPKLGDPRSTTTAQIVDNTLYITVNTEAFKSSNPVFYDSLMSYKMNGYMTFQDSYRFDPIIASRLGNTTGITIEEGSPFAFSNTIIDSVQKEVFVFYGAIPGNSACINFTNCNGEAYNTGISFSPGMPGCAGRAYTYAYNNGNGGIQLTLVMRSEDVVAQSGGCIALDTNWQTGYAPQVLTINTEYVFSDSATAASVSVPVGTVLPTIPNAAYIAFMPTGWCTISLMLNVPAGDVSAKK